MRRRAFKLRQFNLGGAKVNATHIGSFLQTYFVVGDSHNNVRLYTFESDEEIASYGNQNNHNVPTEVTAVSLSSTEKEIYSGTNRGIINVWDMETAKAAVPLRGHSAPVNCFGIYPEEPAKLASGSYDTMIKLWDIRDKNCTATLKGHKGHINSLAVSPDGNLLLSGAQDSHAKLWELRMGEKPIYTSNQHSGPVLKVKFNPQDCMFATCSADKTAKYFRCEDKCFGFASSTDLVSMPITSITFSEDGKLLYTAANDLLKSWNMYKGGIIVEQVETSWKGVQDIAMIQEALMGIAFSAGNLSLWVWDVKQKIKNSSRVSEGQSSLVLPKIGTKYSKKENDFNVNQLQNIVGMAVQQVNKIEQKSRDNVDHRKEQQERRRQDMEKKKEEMLKRKQEEQRKQKQLQIERERERQRQLLEKLLRQKQEKQKREQERLRKEEQEKMQQQRLYQERQEREKEIQARLKQTFEEHEQNNTMQYDNLENSLNLNISTFVADGAQKEKLRQVELISQIMKEKGKFESVLRDKINAIKPIINYWKQGKTALALELISKSNQIIMSECVTAILTTPLFKQSLTIQNGTKLTGYLCELMKTSKHSIYVTTCMTNLNRIVLIFKDDLIRIKSFKPMARVDLNQEERLAKYDKLIQQFMTVFRQERLKKYSERKRQGQNDQLCNAAMELYKNLEEVLIKIMPRQQPELA